MEFGSRAERGRTRLSSVLAVLREDERLSWRATAVGDSILVHLRAPAEGQPPIVTAFPLAHSAAFPQNPTLLSSAATEPLPSPTSTDRRLSATSGCS